MRIDLNINGNKYQIDVDANCYTPIKFGINKAEGKNFGEETTKDLGYFNKLSNACLRICREELADSKDTISLKEFASRIEAINSQFIEQLKSVEV